MLEDLYKNVADYVEKLYKNWYPAALGSQWTKLVSDELAKGSGALAGIAQQAFPLQKLCKADSVFRQQGV